MFRNLILSGTVAVATIAGLTITPTSADAHERHGRHENRHFTRFEVIVRNRGCWEVQKTYASRHDAMCEAVRLRHCGSVVEVRPCR
jgi:hypothetical protein